MIIVGCDFHPGWQQVAVFDSATGEIREQKLENGNGEAERFYRSLPTPARVGFEACGNERSSATALMGYSNYEDALGGRCHDYELSAFRDNCDPAPCDVLLVFQRPVAGHKHFKASLFRHFEQLAVFQATQPAYETVVTSCCEIQARSLCGRFSSSRTLTAAAGRESWRGRSASGFSQWEARGSFPQFLRQGCRGLRPQ